MDINKLLNQYALGEVTRSQLEIILHEVGYTKVLTGVLLNRAERKKADFAKRLITAVLQPETVDGWTDIITTREK